MAETLGISATFPIELYALIEKYASDKGYTDKDGPKRGTAVTQIVADALGFNMAKPASKNETAEQKKARENANQKVKTAEAKVKLAQLTGRGLEEAQAKLVEAQAALAAATNGTSPAPATEGEPAHAGRAR